jgi:uncharacterized protein (TIGR00730 family)
MELTRVCVFCASSQRAHPEYYAAARRTGQILARHGTTIVYGGGGAGSMGALADGALAEGGHIVGILPRFMQDLEWGHSGLSELLLVNDLHERKRLMMAEADALVALPGGCGTLEELLEALTLKRLGFYANPIVLVNTRRFFDPLLRQLEECVAEEFMDERHRAMWHVVDEPEQLIAALHEAPAWPSDARGFAALKK